MPEISSGQRYEPSDFQAEILALNFDQFVAETNIKKIVMKAHSHGVELSQDDLNKHLRYYYDFRVQTTKWYTNPIKDLEFKIRECKRCGGNQNDIAMTWKQVTRARRLSVFSEHCSQTV